MSHAAKRPRRDALSLDSLDVAALDADVAAAIRNASVRTVAAAGAPAGVDLPFAGSRRREPRHAAAYAYSKACSGPRRRSAAAPTLAAALRVRPRACAAASAWGAAAAPISSGRRRCTPSARAHERERGGVNDDATRHRHEAQCAHFSRTGTTIRASTRAR